MMKTTVKDPSESDFKEAYESCQLLDLDEEDVKGIDILCIICKFVYLIILRKIISCLKYFLNIPLPLNKCSLS